MNQNEMIHSIRAEIAKLQRVLDVLEEGPSEVKEQRRPGRPKVSGSKATSFNPEEFSPKKRMMSAEGKARIVEAQKKRWAAKKAAPSKRVAGKQATKAVGKKTAPATVAKASGAGKRTNAAQKRATATKPAAAKKIVAKKTTARKTSRPIPKPAKQASSSSTEPQATS